MHFLRQRLLFSVLSVYASILVAISRNCVRLSQRGRKRPPTRLSLMGGSFYIPLSYIYLYTTSNSSQTTLALSSKVLWMEASSLVKNSL